MLRTACCPTSRSASGTSRPGYLVFHGRCDPFSALVPRFSPASAARFGSALNLNVHFHMLLLDRVPSYSYISLEGITVNCTEMQRQWLEGTVCDGDLVSGSAEPVLDTLENRPPGGNLAHKVVTAERRTNGLALRNRTLAVGGPHHRQAGGTRRVATGEAPC